MSAPLPVALALRVYPPRQGSILSASLAPRSRLEPPCQHCNEASSSQGCLMSLPARLSPPRSPDLQLFSLSREPLGKTNHLPVARNMFDRTIFPIAVAFVDLRIVDRKSTRLNSSHRCIS